MWAVRIQLFWHDHRDVLAGLGPFQPRCGPLFKKIKTSYPGPPPKLVWKRFLSDRIKKTLNSR